MKGIKNLFLVLGLMLSLVGGLLALPVDMSGQLTYGFTTDGNKLQVSYADAYSYFKVKPSDFTTATLKLAYFTNAQPAAPVGSGGRTIDANFAKLYAEEMYVTQDFAGLFGASPDIVQLSVDMGVKNNAVVSWPPTDFSMENVSAYDPGAMDTVGVRSTFYKKVTVNLWFNPHGQGVYNSETNPMRVGGQMIFDVAPMKLTGWFASAGQKTLDKGIIGGEANFNQAFGPITLIADLEVINNLLLITDDALTFGPAVQVVYDIYQMSVSNISNKANPKELGIDATITPIKPFSIICGTAFNLRPDAKKQWDGAEFGGSLKWDKIKFRFGYLMTETGMNGVSMYCPNPLPNGGMFLKCILAY